ncbi:MAG: carboxy terminal-processing peptidase [Sphingobacteriaceae bacterium]|nr:carboxy terminal-processing peptidase [Cytophagaceae bacterium]
MKKYLLSLIPLVLLSFQPDTPSSAYPNRPTTDLPGELQPTVSQKRVEEYVTQILLHHHYRKVTLDDALSAKIWDAYLKEVDGNKWYLTAADVDNFNKYRLQMDEALPSGDLKGAYEVYNLFIKRVHARNEAVAKLLETPFEFSKDESYETDRDKMPWAKSEAELDDIWRKIVKSQALDLKLSGKADTAIVSTLKQRYVNLDKQFLKIKGDYVFQEFMNAFAETIDPHTTYFSPPDASRFKDEMAQSFEGIGATLRSENDMTKIVDVLPGGPALKSGLVHKDDKIVGVAQGDGTAMLDVVGWTTDEVVKKIRGPKGTVVRLNVIPFDAPTGATPKEVRLVRDKIKLEDGVAKKIIVPINSDGKQYRMGVITILGFYQASDDRAKGDREYNSTTRDVKKFLNELKAEKVDGVVIDLRNNGGGSLDEAINLSGLFIKNGPVVQVRAATGEVDVDEDPDPLVVYDGPLAVLVNRFSASASEIFAAAIQDYKRGLVIGEQTYGKGTVQQLIDLSQFMPKEKESEKAGLLKVTRSKFYRINGASTQLRGVTPDVELPSLFSAEEYGESSQPSALPWDQIASAQYQTYRDVSEQMIKQLRGNYEKRLGSDPELVKLSADSEEWRKAKDKTVISLQLDKRKQERDEAEKKRQTIAKTSNTPAPGLTPEDSIEAKIADGTDLKAALAKLDKDLFLKETNRILADFITIKK